MAFRILQSPEIFGTTKKIGKTVFGKSYLENKNKALTGISESGSKNKRLSPSKSQLVAYEKIKINAYLEVKS